VENFPSDFRRQLWIPVETWKTFRFRHFLANTSFFSPPNVDNSGDSGPFCPHSAHPNVDFSAVHISTAPTTKTGVLKLKSQQPYYIGHVDKSRWLLKPGAPMPATV
jgi:hypothetical protein